MRGLIDEVLQRLQVVPDAKADQQQLILEDADRRRIAGIGLQAPDEARCPVGNDIDFAEAGDEACHVFGFQFVPREGDVDLRKLVFFKGCPRVAGDLSGRRTQDSGRRQGSIRPILDQQTGNLREPSPAQRRR